MSNLLGYTYFSDFDRLWANPRFRLLASYLEMMPEKDAKGSHWPYGDEAIKNLEKVFAYFKDKASNDDPESVVLEARKFIKNLGTNEVGESLLKKVIKEITWEAISKEKKEEPFLKVQPGEVDEKAELEAQEKIEKMKEDLQDREEELKTYELA